MQVDARLLAAAMTVVPVFALIAAGFAAAKLKFISEGAHRGISEFAFSVAIPALLFRTIVIADFPAASAFEIWAAYYGAVALAWIGVALVSRLGKANSARDRAVLGVGSVYGNLAMLGLPLTLSALGNDAAGPMALILAINNPLLWLGGMLQIAWSERQAADTTASLVVPLFSQLARNPIMLAIVCGFLWRLTGAGLHPVADKTINLLGQAGSPTALVALGISLVRFTTNGQKLQIALMCAVKLLAMPALAWALAVHVFKLPHIAVGVVVMFAAMPAGANAYLFAVQYRRLENSVSGAVALGSIFAALTIPIVIFLIDRS